jgi:hypothetical protein
MVNPLNAELNSICHLLILLGDLTFMGKCIVSVSNKMQRYTAYLYLETALHVSSGTSTHHKEHIQLYLQHLVFVTQIRTTHLTLPLILLHLTLVSTAVFKSLQCWFDVFPGELVQCGLWMQQDTVRSHLWAR